MAIVVSAVHQRNANRFDSRAAAVRSELRESAFRQWLTLKIAARAAPWRPTRRQHRLHGGDGHVHQVFLMCREFCMTLLITIRQQLFSCLAYSVETILSRQCRTVERLEIPMAEWTNLVVLMYRN